MGGRGECDVLDPPKSIANTGQPTMNDYRDNLSGAQPIRECFKRILLQVVANASPKSEQKELILILHENEIIGTVETFALIHVYGLASA
mgnify:CR=1 FL=1